MIRRNRAEREVDPEQQMERYLDNNLFNTAKETKGGAKTFLNVSCLRELYYYILQYKLSEEQRATVQGYQLQILLIEIFQEKATYCSVDNVIEKVLERAKASPEFWSKHSETYKEIMRKQRNPPVEVVLQPTAEPPAVKAEIKLKAGKKSNNKKLAKQEKVKEIKSKKGQKRKQKADKDNQAEKTEEEQPKVESVQPDLQNPPIETLVPNVSSFPESPESELSQDQYNHGVKVSTAKAHISTLTFSESMENYKKYMAMAAQTYCKTPFHDEHRLDDWIDRIWDAIVPNDPDSLEEIDTLLEIYYKERRKSKINPSHCEYFSTRNRLKVLKNFDTLKQEFEWSNQALGKRLCVDFTDYNVLDYRSRIFVNTKYCGAQKLRLNILPLIYRFLLQELKIDAEVDCPFYHLFQNFLLFLNFSRTGIEFETGRTKQCRKDQTLKELLSDNNIGHGNTLLRFERFCAKNNLSLISSLEKIECLRVRQLTFLANTIILGQKYCESYVKGTQTSFRPKKTYSTLPDSSSRKEKRLSGPEKNKMLAKLELRPNLDRGTAHDLALFYIKHNDSQLSPDCQESLFRYSKQIKKRLDFIVKYPDLYTTSYESSTHPNTYSHNDNFTAATNTYKDYILHPETKAKLAYKYFGETEFRWSEKNYRQFVSAYAKYKCKQINNNRIANEIGGGVSTSQIKQIKLMFRKHLIKRALQNKRNPDEQLNYDLGHFDLKTMFPWVREANLLKE